MPQIIEPIGGKNRTPIIYSIDQKGCWICIGRATVSNGWYTTVSRNGVRYQTHRYVYQIMKGEIPEGKILRHKCDESLCINPEHLLIGTQADNMADAAERGRMPRGENNHYAKLSKAQVLEVIQSKKSGAELARKFSVTRGAIYAIKTQKTWKHVSI